MGINKSQPSTARRSILWVSTREPRKSRVVFSVCSRARYTRNPSLDIYLLGVHLGIIWQIYYNSVELNPNPDRPSFPTFGSYAYGENVDAAGGAAATTAAATSAAALLLAAAALVKLN